MRVDGVDLREVKLRSYRRQLGVVLQDPFLFSGTIASNIRFGKPDASDEEVAAAAAAVGVDRVAARSQAGSTTRCAKAARALGGRAPLISIARALLADPRILILDEATSNIDRPTEVFIEQALDRLLHGRTSIIIAHRLSTVRRADEIVVIEHGRIVQRGTERELLGQGRPVPPACARPHRRRGREAAAGQLAASSLEDLRQTSTTRGVELRAGAFAEPAHRLGMARRLRYGRSVVIAWYASQTKMIRASSGMSSPASRSG